MSATTMVTVEMVKRLDKLVRESHHSARSEAKTLRIAQDLVGREMPGIDAEELAWAFEDWKSWSY